MHHVTHHPFARPVQRQNARRHIARIAGNYRRHCSDDFAPYISGRLVTARGEVIRAFAAYMASSRRAILARSEA